MVQSQQILFWNEFKNNEFKGFVTDDRGEREDFLESSDLKLSFKLYLTETKELSVQKVKPFLDNKITNILANGSAEEKDQMQKLLSIGRLKIPLSVATVHRWMINKLLETQEYILYRQTGNRREQRVQN